jgi:hypothetical protein
MDKAEIDRRIVGLLTLAYREEWDPEAGADLRVLGAAVTSLTEQIGVHKNSHEIPLYDFEEMKRSSDIPLLIAGFVGIFVELCHEVREAHPEFDIADFLKQKGLEAAGGLL